MGEDMIVKAMSDSGKRVVFLEYDFKEKYPKENVVSWQINKNNPIQDIRIAMRMSPDYLVIKF